MPRTDAPALVSARRLPNGFDMAAAALIFAALIAVASVARHTLAPLSAPGALKVTLDPANLPGYALRTTARLFAALVASIVFTFVVATWAAKSRRAAKVLIPALDILQSVPILGFLSFTVVFFMSLFPGRVLGAELASIFAVFTGQAWNMTFSMYQSLITIPADLDEAARGFHLTAWQRFWRLEVPFAMPGLVYNTMLSMSGSWFFVVASEAISVGDTTWKLPGIGSYVALALEQRDIAAVFYAIVAMLVVILAYDQLLFRPLVAWSAKFRFEMTASAPVADPWMLRLVRRAHLLRIAGEWTGDTLGRLGGLRLAPGLPGGAWARSPSRAVDAAWLIVLALLVAASLWAIATYVSATLSWADAGQAFVLGLYTLLRVAVVLVVSALIWVPIGTWLGLRPAWAQRAQPVAQFLAAFPANLFFPIVVLAIVHFHLNTDIWLTPLMLLGTQWYLLFNVVAGAAAFPADLKEAAANLGIRRVLWWRRVMLPGIFPYLITGAITASGNAWNTSIVAEVASWGNTRLTAHGLGAYIAEATAAGDTAKVVLGVAVMAALVLVVNRLIWRPLYAFAVRRMTIA